MWKAKLFTVEYGGCVVMRHVYGNAFATTNEMQGQYVQGRDICVPPFKWAAFARHCWPHKTAAHLAALAGKDERTAKRWLAGEFDLPNQVLLALIAELLKREGQ